MSRRSRCVLYLWQSDLLAGEERAGVERRRSGGETSQRSPGRVQLQLQVGGGRLDQNCLEDVRVHGLQQDRVGQHGLQEGRVNAGRGEVVTIIVNTVLGQLGGRGGELGVQHSQSQAATWK